MKILILGKGWVGSICKEKWGDEAIVSDKRINSKQDALDIIDEVKPDVVLNTAGVTGKPNVDWCETNQMKTILGNTVLPILLAEACAERDLYLLHVGSGCVFYGDSPHENKEWKEGDFANPLATYSKAKYAADLVLQTLPNVGIARIRMPIESKPSPRNLIDKLVAYDRIIDVENSVTILDDMVDVFYQLLAKKGEGVFHVVNDGRLKHRTIIDLYKKYVDESIEKEWITEDELVEMGLATKKRSNNFLSNENLTKLGIHIPDVNESIVRVMEKYKDFK